jgi:putative endonuclease
MSGDSPSRSERPPRRELGREAEALAERYLAGLGYRTLARNHATRRGEVDLICREGEVIAFVEVRSRSSAAQGSPLETVGPAKARRVVAAATDWAQRHGALGEALRFDVVAVLLDGPQPRFELVRGAFDASGQACP